MTEVLGLETLRLGLRADTIDLSVGRSHRSGRSGVANLVPGQYRKVSVATVADVPLTVEGLTAHFLGREVYRHTRFVVVRSASRRRDRRGRGRPSRRRGPVRAGEGGRGARPPPRLRLRGRPRRRHGHPVVAGRGGPGAGARCPVRGGGGPVPARELHPRPPADPHPGGRRGAAGPGQAPRPGPAGAGGGRGPAPHRAGARRGRPGGAGPVAAGGAGTCCPARGRASRSTGPRSTSSTSTRPAGDWTLLGCARSRAIHEWFYGDLPETVDTCPRRLFVGGLGRRAPAHQVLPAGGPQRRRAGRGGGAVGGVARPGPAGPGRLAAAEEPSWAPA